LVAQILLRVGLMTQDALEAWLRRHRRRNPLVSGNLRCVRLRSEFRGVAKDVNANCEGGEYHDRQIHKVSEDGLRLNVAGFERDVAVLRRLPGGVARLVNLSAHRVRWPPRVSDRQAGEAAVV